MTPINYGYMVQIQALRIFAGSFLFGLLVDLTGNWVVIGYLCILISICGIFGSPKFAFSYYQFKRNINSKKVKGKLTEGLHVR